MTPTREQVEELATKMFMQRNAVWNVDTLPEHDELKEEGLLEEAKMLLMTSPNVEGKAKVSLNSSYIEKYGKAWEMQTSDIIRELVSKVESLELQIKELQIKSMQHDKAILFKCARCGHSWPKRNKTVTPNICPKCKSRLWNVSKS